MSNQEMIKAIEEYVKHGVEVSTPLNGSALILVMDHFTQVGYELESITDGMYICEDDLANLYNSTVKGL
jgi:hypothetical protein